MSELVIVAIPRDNDPVWKYSSEKVPHMTLLYLGAPPENFDMMHAYEYLERVCETVQPFGLDVDSRGVLGDDQADVLFFKKTGYGTDEPKAIRSFLLQDPYIRTLYDSQEQYPEWTPHLTMGYPATPAKVDEREYSGFSWVQFDKIALWVDDSVGPTFPLEYNYDRSDISLTMGDDVLDFLQHHGVKGMKWGQRRTEAQLNTNAETVHVTGAKTKLGPVKSRVEPFTKAGKYKKKNADTAVTVAHRPGERLTSKGGSNRPAHEDAVKVSVNKRIARSSTTDALSTKDLQDVVNRINLEQQYARLTAEPKNPIVEAGRKMLGDLVRTEANAFAKKRLNDVLIDKGIKTETDNDRKTRENRQAREQGARRAVVNKTGKKNKDK